MARPNPSLTLSVFASIGAGIGTAVRNAMAGGALGNWTVSALQTFGTGGTERNYWVLSAGFVEVLVNLNNSTLNHYSSVWSGKRAYQDLTRTPAFWFAPDGGFNAAFTAGEDPLNESFWTHITTTLSLREPSSAFFLQIMYNGATDVKMYCIADDTDDMFAVYIGDRSGDDRYECLIWASNFLNQGSIEPLEKQPHSESMVWVQVQDAASPPLPNLAFAIWDENDVLVESQFANNDEVQGYLHSLSSSAITARGEIPTHTFLFKTPQRIYARGNENFLRIAPYNDPTAYKDDAGTDANYGWIRLHRYLLAPWEQGATNPT